MKNEYLPSESCNLYFEETVTKWDEAIPLGNGLTGCLVWGNGAPLRLSLDRGDLWDTRPAPELLRENFNYHNMISMVKNNDHDGICNLFAFPYNRVTPTKIPAGRIELLFDNEADSIESSLILADALTNIKLSFKEKQTYVRLFLHATQKIGFIKISGDLMPKAIIKAPQFGTIEAGNTEENSIGIIGDTYVAYGSLEQLKYPKVEYGYDDKSKWFIQKTTQTLEYGIVIGQRIVKDGIEIAFFIGANKDGHDWLGKTKEMVYKALDESFEISLNEHKKWWHEYWEKSSISLPDKEVEKQWYLSNYLFGSCSRKGAPPMPLQGVWTADSGELPPWHGDYHHDLNTQMSYYHYLKANHIDEGYSFIEFLWNLVPTARKFANSFFDAPGLCLPSVMSIDGTALGGWPMYSYTLTNQIWLCHFFEKHWRYTGDNEFLEEKAYPYFKETAKCVYKWLSVNNEGKLELPLSSSPEIHDNSMAAWLFPNSNYDISLLRYLYQTLTEMAEYLGYDEKKEWQTVLFQLPGFAVNSDNVLMVNQRESLTESHRHFAHAMPIHPLYLIDYHGSMEEKKIIDATIANLEALGTGLWVGFSFTWMAELYALQGNGEGAAYQLKLFWENLCSQNGFHLNGDFMKRGVTALHYRPFTLESNMCAADAVQEMLLQTYGGIIRVFPAIPDKWRKNGVSFKKFVGYDGVLISAQAKGGDLQFIKLVAQKVCICKIVNMFSEDTLLDRRNEGCTEIKCCKGEIFQVSLKQGEEAVILINDQVKKSNSEVERIIEYL